jgi:hypothetical protein
MSSVPEGLKKTLVKHSPSNKITHSSNSQFFNNHKHGRWTVKGMPTEWPHIPRSTSITVSLQEDILRSLSIHPLPSNNPMPKNLNKLKTCILVM